MSDKEKDIGLYERLGVSSDKKEVHKAIESVDKGLFPGAFCKIVEDLNDRKDYCSIFHADGAGTKSSLAYMVYKETGDISVFKGIVRDVIVMNIDDILCVGANGKILLSNSIGRNKRYISGEIITIIIKEYEEYSNFLSEYGLKVVPCGGETADVGDLVKTLIIDASIITSLKRKDVINARNIKPGDVIVGLASDGQTTYEDEYNSGIGSNGLTLARHGTLLHKYYNKYPEAFDQDLEEELVFFGKYDVDEKIQGLKLPIGKALLSPTRTYVPVLMEILKKHREEIHGIIHISGGGQTKTQKFGSQIHYIKNDLFKTPKIFEIIQGSSGTQWEEMYIVFNMGHRMEILCEESIAQEIIQISKNFNVDSKIIGLCERTSSKNSLSIKSEYGSFDY